MKALQFSVNTHKFIAAKALKRAVASGKPACINVLTDPTVLSPATAMFYQNLADFE